MVAVDMVPQSLVTVNNMAPDSTSADFTVSPTGGTFQLGPHAVYFPSYSICDPNVSSYGVGTWDQPCQPLYRSIAIHAEVRNINGSQVVDFTPSLRFVPSNDASRWVWIAMRTNVDGLTSWANLNILWSPYLGAQGIDETASDPTLQTISIPAYNLVVRRIKHFSGYMVAL